MESAEHQIELAALLPGKGIRAGSPTLKLSQKGLVLIAVPLMFQILSFGLLYGALSETERQVKREAFARSVNQHLNRVTTAVMEASAALVHYGIGSDSKYLEIYRSATDKVPLEFAELHKLLDNDKDQARALAGLEEAVNRSMALLDEAKYAARRRDLSLVFKYLSQMKGVSDRLGIDLGAVTKRFAEMEEDSAKQALKAKQLVNFALLAIASSIVVATALHLHFNRHTSGRLATLVDNTLRFSRQQPLHEPLSGGDEMAHLDLVFHDMADAITRAIREKQEFMAMITHDIRSPLTGVIGSLSLLAEPKMGFDLNEKAQQVVARCEVSVGRLLRLANDLLDIEKLEAGKMKMHFEPAELAYVIDQSVQTMRAQADQRNIQLEAAQTDVQIFADADRLVQVLVNLLSNALKYSPDQSTIKIEAQQLGSWYEVRVVDQGPGIPADYKDKMFQRFQQVDTAERKKYGGTGLGLAICKEVVAAHNGEIGVESTEGMGSTFWFRIPSTEEAMNKGYSG